MPFGEEPPCACSSPADCQNDSGLESLTASKGDTPERKPMDQPAFNFPVGPTDIAPLKEFDDVSIKSPSSTLSTLSPIVNDDTNCPDEPDETLSERLWGLTEMFPEKVRTGAYTVTTKSWSGMKSLYSLSRCVMWVIASSSVILFAPVIFEVERAQMAEMEKSQQKQVLLGTNTAMSGPMPPMPPMPR